MAYASLFLVGTGIVVLVLLIAMLNRTILRPLATLTTHAVAIGRNDDLGVRLALDRADEIGRLASEFDRMLESLADARRQLVDRSFEAGVAENASGVLHNLGNAITPLGVRIATLQQRLQSAPSGDLELVLAERRAGTADAGRRDDLDQFLQLAAGELVLAITDAQQEVAAAASQVQAIQEILVAQSCNARAERVIEVVALPDLVQQALGMVDPELLRRLTIESDAGLSDIGPLHLARTALKQVFQNLIINAAESMRDAGRERGTLRIGGRIEARAGRRAPAPEFRGRRRRNRPGAPRSCIFETASRPKRRAPTRASACTGRANTIAALGGRIRAESAGAGRGARFEVVLPVRCPATIALTNAA